MKNCYKQTTHGLPSPLLGKPQGGPEEGFPRAARAMGGDTGEASQHCPLPAGRGWIPCRLRWWVAALLEPGKAHTSSYLWFSHNHIGLPFFWTKIYIFIKNWSPNFNDFIHGLESGSKGTDPIMTRRLRDRKSSSSGRESIKLESEAHLLSPIHASPPTDYAGTQALWQRGSRAPSPH